MSRANSLNVQTFVDARLGADIARAFTHMGVAHKGSYSHMLGIILDAVHEQWDCHHFDSTEDALSFLDASGFSVAQLGDARKGKTLLKTINQEQVTQEAGGEPPVVDEGRVEEITNLFNEEPQDAKD